MFTIAVVQEAQLAAISDVVLRAREQGVQIWLRGGWAMDFTLGRWTRLHEDVDFFILTESLGMMAKLLIADGWDDVGTSPRDQQRDLCRAGVEVGIAPVTISPHERPLVGGGPWVGAAYPADMLTNARECELNGVVATAIPPVAQIELKRMMPHWVPSLRRRAQDDRDITLLEAFLEKG